MYKLQRVSTWSEVEEVASLGQTCIRPDGGSNEPRARQTWDVFAPTGDVIYFLIQDGERPNQNVGYLRLLRASGTGAASTWIVDFVRPNSYEPVLLAKELVEGTLLAKSWGNEDVKRSWPVIQAGFPKLARYPYKAQSGAEHESSWLVVL